eukprot:gene5294-18538_t
MPPVIVGVHFRGSLIDELFHEECSLQWDYVDADHGPCVVEVAPIEVPADLPGVNAVDSPSMALLAQLMDGCGRLVSPVGDGNNCVFKCFFCGFQHIPKIAQAWELFRIMERPEATFQNGGLACFITDWVRPTLKRRLEALLSFGDDVQEVQYCLDSFNGKNEGMFPPHTAFVMGDMFGVPVVVLGDQGQQAGGVLNVVNYEASEDFDGRIKHSVCLYVSSGHHKVFVPTADIAVGQLATTHADVQAGAFTQPIVLPRVVLSLPSWDRFGLVHVIVVDPIVVGDVDGETMGGPAAPVPPIAAVDVSDGVGSGPAVLILEHGPGSDGMSIPCRATVASFMEADGYSMSEGGLGLVGSGLLCSVGADLTGSWPLLVPGPPEPVWPGQAQALRLSASHRQKKSVLDADVCQARPSPLHCLKCPLPLVSSRGQNVPTPDYETLIPISSIGVDGLDGLSSGRLHIQKRPLAVDAPGPHAMKRPTLSSGNHGQQLIVPLCHPLGHKVVPIAGGTQAVVGPTPSGVIHRRSVPVLLAGTSLLKVQPSGIGLNRAAIDFGRSSAPLKPSMAGRPRRQTRGRIKRVDERAASPTFDGHSESECVYSDSEWRY